MSAKRSSDGASPEVIAASIALVRSSGAETLLGLRNLARIEGGGSLVHQARHQRLEAQLAPRVRGVAGIELERDEHHRHGGSTSEAELDPIGKRGFLHVGEIEIRNLPDRGKFGAVHTGEAARRPAGLACRRRHRGGWRSERLLAGTRCPVVTRPMGRTGSGDRRLLIRVALAGHDAERKDRASEPFLERCPHGLRSDSGVGLEPFFVEARVVRIKGALGERDSLAAKASDLFQPANAI
jgi:hypothetical protein